jgi:hypothetical protein
LLKEQLDKFRDGKNLENYDFDKDGNLKIDINPEEKSILDQNSNMYGA